MHPFSFLFHFSSFSLLSLSQVMYKTSLAFTFSLNLSFLFLLILSLSSFFLFHLSFLPSQAFLLCCPLSTISRSYLFRSFRFIYIFIEQKILSLPFTFYLSFSPFLFSPFFSFFFLWPLFVFFLLTFFIYFPVLLSPPVFSFTGSCSLQYPFRLF